MATCHISMLQFTNGILQFVGIHYKLRGHDSPKISKPKDLVALLEIEIDKRIEIGKKVWERLFTQP